MYKCPIHGNSASVNLSKRLYQVYSSGEVGNTRICRLAYQTSKDPEDTIASYYLTKEESEEWGMEFPTTIVVDTGENDNAVDPFEGIHQGFTIMCSSCFFEFFSAEKGQAKYIFI